MKKVKSNRYQQALVEIQKMDENLSAKVNQEIKESDKEHFHVILVKVKERQGAVKNDVSVVTQPFNQVAFEKLEKSYQFLGYNKIILLHDPRLETQEEVVDTKPIKTQEEIDEEIEARAQQIAQERLDAMNGKEDEKGKKESNEFVCGDSLAEMKEFAEKNEIDITGLKKNEIKPALLAWHNEKITE